MGVRVAGLQIAAKLGPIRPIRSGTVRTPQSTRLDFDPLKQGYCNQNPITGARLAPRTAKGHLPLPLLTSTLTKFQTSIASKEVEQSEQEHCSHQ
jgi:hypothetical protein